MNKTEQLKSLLVKEGEGKEAEVARLKAEIEAQKEAAFAKGKDVSFRTIERSRQRGVSVSRTKWNTAAES